MKRLNGNKIEYYVTHNDKLRQKMKMDICIERTKKKKSIKMNSKYTLRCVINDASEYETLCTFLDINATDIDKSIIDKSFTYVRLLERIYNNSNLSIGDFDNSNADNKDRCIEELNNKIRKWNNNDDYRKVLAWIKNNSKKSFIKNSICMKNFEFSISKTIKLHRILYYDFESKTLSFGRIYGCKLDSTERYLKALLNIDGIDTIEFDLVCSLIQIAGLEEGFNVTGIDFYVVEELIENGLSRDEIKLGYVLLQNCKSVTEILRYCVLNKRWNIHEMFKKRLFQKYVYKKYPFLEKYHLKIQENNRLIMLESEIIMDIINELYINHKIVAYYCFDAIFVPNNSMNMKITKDVFDNVFLKRYNQRPNIHISVGDDQ